MSPDVSYDMSRIRADIKKVFGAMCKRGHAEKELIGLYLKFFNHEPTKSKSMDLGKMTTYMKLIFGDGNAHHYMSQGDDSKESLYDITTTYLQRIRDMLIKLRICREGDTPEWKKEDLSSWERFLAYALDAAISDRSALNDHAQDAEWRERCETRLTELIESSPRSLKVLEEKSGLFEGDNKLKRTGKARAADAARRLLDPNVELKRLNEGFSTAYDSTLEVLRTEEGKKAAEVLVEAIQLILPCRFDADIARKLRKYMDDPAALAQLLEFCMPTMVDIVVAAAERRPTQYRFPEKYDPVGKQLLAYPPEPGLSGNAHEATGTQIEQKFSPALERKLQYRVRDELMKFYRPVPGLAYSPDQQKEFAKRRFAQASKPWRYYIIAEGEVEELREWKEAFRELRQC